MQDRKRKPPGAVDVLFFLGAGLLSLGAWLGFGPAAGCAAAGAFCLAASFLADRPGGKDGEDTA